MLDLNKLKETLRDDEVVAEIAESAHQSLRRHLGRTRGQMITPADSIELHVMHATIDALIREYEGWVCVPMEPFVVKHYSEYRRPIIKGNGFDGLEVGTDREEAEEFVRWINTMIAAETTEDTDDG